MSGIVRGTLIHSFLRRAGAALGNLALSLATIARASAPGTLVGTLLGTTGTLTLINSAGGRFALVGNTVVTGNTAL